ncbi:SDR family oxidoreductase [Bradyrhizobium erythrophlei]|uniref:SDR family oxidoreductase n=1 Tax=Bradyrhizobium erythrophlei TaxID=1437360 RepID=UPI0035E7627F
MNIFSLENRTALITGGSRGIGRMIAEGFVAQGARVYISSRDSDACRQTAIELSGDGGICRPLPQDISTMKGVRTLAEKFAAAEPGLDILVNNAGAAWGSSFESFPEQGWDKVLDLNLKSPFFLTQALLGSLEAAASKEAPGKVINIASIDGLRPNPQATYSYQASKAGLIHLTRRMAAELIRRNICVTAIAPGAFASRMNKDARDRADEVAAVIPAGRIGTARDMQGVAIFLASRAGDYLVGATIPVDGGVALAHLSI